jgi:two-component system, OmpR family, response regulator
MPQSPSADRDRPLVLLVEDDPMIASMLAKSLEEAGMGVRTAGSGSAMDVLYRRADDLTRT